MSSVEVILGTYVLLLVKFRDTYFHHLFGCFPGGPFCGFRRPRVPQRERFWRYFLHFWGSGPICVGSSFVGTKPLSSTSRGVQNAAQGPLSSKAVFQEGPRGAFCQILVILGSPLGPLGEHF